MVLFVECCAEQSGFVLWLCTLDEDSFHGEMLNSAAGRGAATALLFVLVNVPGKVFFLERSELPCSCVTV